jgi:hypothetical protein
MMIIFGHGLPAGSAAIDYIVGLTLSNYIAADIYCFSHGSNFPSLK